MDHRLLAGLSERRIARWRDGSKYQFTAFTEEGVGFVHLPAGGLIVERHSIGKFLPLPVPREVVDEALALAQHEPSNSEMTSYGMYTERVCRLRDARIEVRRKLNREIAWFCITLAASMTLWAAAYAAGRWLVS